MRAAEATRAEDVPAKQGERTDIGKLPKFPQSARAAQNGIGERTQRKLDRIARDHPVLHEQVKTGQLSVNAAAIKAGMVKPTVSIPLDPEGAARCIVRHFSQEQLDELIARLIAFRQSRPG